jgi:hypothetical protein
MQGLLRVFAFPIQRHTSRSGGGWCAAVPCTAPALPYLAHCAVQCFSTKTVPGSMLPVPKTIECWLPVYCDHRLLPCVACHTVVCKLARVHHSESEMYSLATSTGVRRVSSQPTRKHYQRVAVRVMAMAQHAMPSDMPRHALPHVYVHSQVS